MNNKIKKKNFLIVSSQDIQRGSYFTSLLNLPDTTMIKSFNDSDSILLYKLQDNLKNYKCIHLRKYNLINPYFLYVNIINYGDNNQGIYEPATNYFNVLPYQLSMEQSTILAGIPNLPGYYQLSDHYQNAKQRQYNVLVCMEDCGYITKDEIETIWNGSIY